MNENPINPIKNQLKGHTQYHEYRKARQQTGPGRHEKEKHELDQLTLLPIGYIGRNMMRENFSIPKIRVKYFYTSLTEYDVYTVI